MIVIANIFTAIGMLLLTYSTFARNKSKMLLVQVGDCLFNSIGYLILASYSAAITNIIAGLRNLINAKGKNTIFLNWMFAIILTILGLLFNKNGIIGLIPIICSLIYTACSYVFKTAQSLRFVLVFNTFLWIIHDYSCKLYTSNIFSVIIIVVTIINIIRLRDKNVVDSKDTKIL